MKPSLILAACVATAFTLAPQGTVAQPVNQLMQQATTATTAKDFARAEQLWRRVIQQQPENAEAYASLGDALLNQNRAEAIDAYDRALKLNPNIPRAHNGRGFVLFFLGEYDQAIAAYERAIQLDPSQIAPYLNLSQVMAVQDKTREAVAACRKAIQIAPRNAEAYKCLGKALPQERSGEAIAAFRKATQLNPRDPDSYAALGYLLRDQGKLNEAAVAYQTAIQVNSTVNPSHFLELQDVFERQKRPEKMIPVYQAAIQRYGQKPSSYDKTLLYTQLGSALLKQNRLAEAETTYREAIDQEPNPSPMMAPAYNGLGLVLQRQGKLPEAIAAYRQALKLDPNLTVAAQNLATAERQQQQ